MSQWIRGTRMLLLPIEQLEHYPQDAVGRPAKPVAAFACEGEGWAGLALHDTESTTFVPLDDGGGLLAQLIYSDGPDEARAALAASVPNDGWKELGFVYRAMGDEHLLFPAFVAGADLGDAGTREMLEDMGAAPMLVALPAGEYSVAAQVGFAPDAQVEWTLVRLTRR